MTNKLNIALAGFFVLILILATCTYVVMETEKRTSRPSIVFTTGSPMEPSFPPDTGHVSSRYGSLLTSGAVAGAVVGPANAIEATDRHAMAAEHRNGVAREVIMISLRLK